MEHPWDGNAWEPGSATSFWGAKAEKSSSPLKKTTVTPAPSAKTSSKPVPSTKEDFSTRQSEK